MKGADGFSFASRQVMGKPNQDIPELLSTFNFKIAPTEKNWSQHW